MSCLSLWLFFFNYSWHFVFKPTMMKKTLQQYEAKKSISKALKMFIIFDLLFILEFFYILIIYSSIIHTAFILLFFLPFFPCFLIKKNPSFYQHQKRSHIRSKKKKQKKTALWKYVCWYFINQGKKQKQKRKRTIKEKEKKNITEQLVI